MSDELAGVSASNARLDRFVLAVTPAGALVDPNRPRWVKLSKAKKMRGYKEARGYPVAVMAARRTHRPTPFEDGLPEFQTEVDLRVVGGEDQPNWIPMQELFMHVGGVLLARQAAKDGIIPRVEFVGSVSTETTHRCAYYTEEELEELGEHVEVERIEGEDEDVEN